MMNSYEITTIVDQSGRVFVAGVPFAPGTEVDVTVSPKRKSASEFEALWRHVCGELREATSKQTMTDDELQREIDDHRAGR